MDTLNTTHLTNTIDIVCNDFVMHVPEESARLCNIIATCIDDIIPDNTNRCKDEPNIVKPLFCKLSLSKDELIMFFDNLCKWNIMTNDEFYYNIISKLELTNQLICEYLKLASYLDFQKGLDLFAYCFAKLINENKIKL